MAKTGCADKNARIILFRNADVRTVVIVEPNSDPEQALENDGPRVVGTLTDKRTCQIMFLYVPFVERGRGHAVTLLGSLAEMLAEDGCCRIELDDMSDRYRNKHNVYTRVGFHYSGRCGPEMTASRRKVVHMCKTYRAPPFSLTTLVTK